MTSENALLAIQEILDGTEWDSDTTEAIAQIMIQAGYRIRDLDDREMAFAVPKTICSVCGTEQFETPGGITCLNGHGGASGIDMKPLTSALTGLKTQFVIPDEIYDDGEKTLAEIASEHATEDAAAAAASGPLQDHERIWLEPVGERTELMNERTWCQDKVWPNDEEPGEPTEYVRADLVIRKDQIDFSLLPATHSFEITDDNGRLVEAGGSTRFCHEREVQVLHDWAAAAVYQISVEQTANQHVVNAVTGIGEENCKLKLQLNKAVTVLKELVSDITSMKTNPPKDSEAAYWFGPFSEFDNNIESADVEWPNLAITAEKAEKLLKELECPSSSSSS